MLIVSMELLGLVNFRIYVMFSVLETYCLFGPKHTHKPQKMVEVEIKEYELTRRTRSYALCASSTI